MTCLLNTVKMTVLRSGKSCMQLLPIALRNMNVQRYNSSANAEICRRLVGKVAVVTASTDGIGYSIVERLAAEGAKVIISSRKEENVEKAIDQLKSKGFNDVRGVKCHVASAEDRRALLQTAVDQFGGVDILVSNAAVNPTVGSVLDCPEEAWDKIFEVNVKAAYLLAKEFAPVISERESGSIVFVSSYAGMNPFPLLGAYSVSKTALFGLTKALAADLAPRNVRVNCVAPGVIRTKFAKALYESETAYDILMTQVPLGRLGEPAEIASLVAFLVSNDAGYVTGETIIASGGMTSRL